MMVWLLPHTAGTKSASYIERRLTMPEQESPIIYYKSGTNTGLPGWDVMLVSQRNKVSVVLARDADGTIIRKIDYSLWEEVGNEEALRVYRKYFENRDRLREQEAASEDDSD
jgi:hypothetical protein